MPTEDELLRQALFTEKFYHGSIPGSEGTFPGKFGPGWYGTLDSELANQRYAGGTGNVVAQDINLEKFLNTTNERNVGNAISRSWNWNYDRVAEGLRNAGFNPRVQDNFDVLNGGRGLWDGLVDQYMRQGLGQDQAIDSANKFLQNMGLEGIIYDQDRTKNIVKFLPQAKSVASGIVKGALSPLGYLENRVQQDVLGYDLLDAIGILFGTANEKNQLKEKYLPRT